MRKFTLIEIMIVLGLVAIVAAAWIFKSSGSVDVGKLGKAKAQAEAVNLAAQAWDLRMPETAVWPTTDNTAYAALYSAGLLPNFPSSFGQFQHTYAGYPSHFPIYGVYMPKTRGGKAIIYKFPKEFKWNGTQELVEY